MSPVLYNILRAVLVPKGSLSVQVVLRGPSLSETSNLRSPAFSYDSGFSLPSVSVTEPLAEETISHTVTEPVQVIDTVSELTDERVEPTPVLSSAQETTVSPTPGEETEPGASGLGDAELVASAEAVIADREWLVSGASELVGLMSNLIAGEEPQNEQEEESAPLGLDPRWGNSREEQLLQLQRALGHDYSDFGTSEVDTPVPAGGEGVSDDPDAKHAAAEVREPHDNVGITLMTWMVGEFDMDFRVRLAWIRWCTKMGHRVRISGRQSNASYKQESKAS